MSVKAKAYLIVLILVSGANGHHSDSQGSPILSPELRRRSVQSGRQSAVWTQVTGLFERPDHRGVRPRPARGVSSIVQTLSTIQTDLIAFGDRGQLAQVVSSISMPWARRAARAIRSGSPATSNREILLGRLGRLHPGDHGVDLGHHAVARRKP